MTTNAARDGAFLAMLDRKLCDGGEWARLTDETLVMLGPVPISTLKLIRGLMRMADDRATDGRPGD